MLGKIAQAVLIASLAAGLSACTVMQSTYQRKADEADALTKRLASLQKQYDALAAENTALKVRNERLLSDLSGMTLQKEKLTTDLAYVTGQRDKLAVDKEELDKILQAKSDTLSQTISELRRRISELDAENGKLRERNAALQKEVAALTKAKEEQVQKVSSTYESLLEKMKSEISKGQVTISELKGKLTVNMVDSILFDSGKAEVKPGGLEVLQKVISILTDVKDKSIRIEGHTDNVRIVGGLAKRYPTNWELSAARAINVTRYLQDQGIDPGQLAAVAYGEWKPVGDNGSPEGRAKNRRIEIILVPKE